MTSSAVGPLVSEDPRRWAARSAEAAEFLSRRRAIAHRLFTEPAYPATGAMNDMCAAAESYLCVHMTASPRTAVWVGGSLGRREMLPNSDLDLFAVDSGSRPESPRLPPLTGFDQVETGSISIEHLSTLASRTLIDLNQFVDGRALWPSPTGDEVTRILASANSYDRQHANLIAEHFYYRHFDFRVKRTAHGPNIKYSSGSSRTTLFFNFLNRISTGTIPATRAARPEFMDGVAAAEKQYGLVGPYRAIDLVHVVKNAAISTFDATGDPRQRYVSSRSLQRIFDLCERRLRPLGHTDPARFIEAYAHARRQLEATVDLIVEETIRRHRSVAALKEIGAAAVQDVPAALVRAVEAAPDDAATILVFGAWSVVTRPNVRHDDLDSLAKVLTIRPAAETGGALMAVACSPAASSGTLRSVIAYLREVGVGSYVLKLVARNPSAPYEIRRDALEAYCEAEFVRVTG